MLVRELQPSFHLTLVRIINELRLTQVIIDNRLLPKVMGVELKSTEIIISNYSREVS